MAARLKLLAEYINDLQELRSVSPDEYQANKLIRKAVERTLHTAIEASLDNALVYGILSRRLGDFDEFARAVVAYLERR